MFRQWLVLCLVALLGIAAPANAQDCDTKSTITAVADLAGILKAKPDPLANLATAANSPPFAKAPKTVNLPTAFVKGGDASWKDSFPGTTSQEQVGILVRDSKGQYKWKRGPSGTSGSWAPNYGDLGAGETMIASLHTHPYSKAEGGFVGAGPSGGDIASMVTQQEPITIVHAGDTVFAVAASKEFTDSLKGLTNAQLSALFTTIDATYDAAFNKALAAGKGFKDAVNEAALVTSTKHKFIFYSGPTSGPLIRRN